MKLKLKKILAGKFTIVPSDFKIRCTTDLYFQWANQKKANFQMKMWAINERSIPVFQGVHL